MQVADPLHIGATKGGLPRGKALVERGSPALFAHEVCSLRGIGGLGCIRCIKVNLIYWYDLTTAIDMALVQSPAGRFSAFRSWQQLVRE